MAEKMRTLNDLLLDELADLYDAEHQLVKALPRMAKAANTPELVSALESHLAETENQVSRLEQVFELLGETPRRKTCDGMAGIIKEGKNALEAGGSPDVLDAAIIAAAQRVEHYEMAAYGCVRTWAQTLGEDQAAALLEATLEEEKNADATLTDVSGNINYEAAEGETEDDEDEAETAPSRSANASGSHGNRSPSRSRRTTPARRAKSSTKRARR